MSAQWSGRYFGLWTLSCLEVFNREPCLFFFAGYGLSDDARGIEKLISHLRVPAQGERIFVATALDDMPGGKAHMIFSDYSGVGPIIDLRMGHSIGAEFIWAGCRRLSITPLTVSSEASTCFSMTLLEAAPEKDIWGGAAAAPKAKAKAKTMDPDDEFEAQLAADFSQVQQRCCKKLGTAKVASHVQLSSS